MHVHIQQLMQQKHFSKLITTHKRKKGQNNDSQTSVNLLHHNQDKTGHFRDSFQGNFLAPG